MKGVVFTEFLEMAEDRFTPEVVEQVLADSDLASGGAYTAIGTYDSRELEVILGKLCAKVGAEPTALLREFGERLFGRFAEGYPMFFKDAQNSFDFLQGVDRHIHVEVKKLYPDAELPKFDTMRSDASTLTLVYSSSRGLGDFAEGLIRGCITHFKESIEVTPEDLSGGKKTNVRFTLQRR